MRPRYNIFLILLLAFTVSCKKNVTRNVYVYTNSYDPYTKVSLFINDNPKGAIPYFGEKLNFDHDSLYAKTLLIKLTGGKNPLTSRDQYGYVKTDAVLDIRKKKSSAVATIGSVNTQTRGEDILIELNFN